MKKGISLIVLIITIVIMIIMVAVVIKVLDNSNIIYKAQLAKKNSEIAAAKEYISVEIQNMKMDVYMQYQRDAVLSDMLLIELEYC